MVCNPSPKGAASTNAESMLCNRDSECNLVLLKSGTIHEAVYGKEAY